MVFKFDYTKKDYTNGQNRFKPKFAWLPVYLKGNGVIVWLQMYQILQVYVVEIIITNLEDKDIGFKKARWVNVDNRLKPKKEQ